jgi:hypothetical protein
MALQSPSKESRRMWFCEMKPMCGCGGLQQGYAHRVRSGLFWVPPPDVLAKSRVPTLRALAEELKVIQARTSFMSCSRDRQAVAAGGRTSC